MKCSIGRLFLYLKLFVVLFSAQPTFVAPVLLAALLIAAAAITSWAIWLPSGVPVVN